MLPLSDVRVLDLTRLLPGPFCTMILADYGAEVIKIEHPDGGDGARQDPELFEVLNRNKKSVTLNLRTKEGRTAFRELSRTADIIVESFRPGVMDRLGIGYESLKKNNPGLIYCALTGYGQDGPCCGRPGHDINYISEAGLLALMQVGNEPPPIPVTQIADLGGGAFPAAVGILLALLARNKTKKGQFIDISMTDGVAHWLITALSAIKDDDPSKWKRNKLPLSGSLACYQIYETKDGRWLSVGCLEAKFWRSFCESLGKNEWIDKQHAPPPAQQKLKDEVQAVIRQKTQKEWLVHFSSVDTCVTPVRKPFEREKKLGASLSQNEQQTSDARSFSMPLIPVARLHETKAKIIASAPKLGEHNEDYLHLS